MKENSIKEDIELLQDETSSLGLFLKCKGSEKYKIALEHILSDYKRVLKENKLLRKDIEGWKKYCEEIQEEQTEMSNKNCELEFEVEKLQKENEELKEDRNNNNEMVALARNEVLNYMTGYEDGKKHKMTATAQVVENQQYHIIQKQMEKYEEHIKRLQKENEELKNEVMEKDLEIIGKEEYTKDSMGEIIEQYYTANEECIPIQKVKDKIRHYQELQDNYIEKYDEINEGLQAMINVLQELIEEREEK